MSRSSDLLLEVRNLRCFLDRGIPVLCDISFDVYQGDILVLQGKSGCGKSTLLKCLAHLNVYDGNILFRGQTPKELGIPNYRTHVLYVPQRPSLLPGSPKDFIAQLNSFSVHASREKQRVQSITNGDSDTSRKSLLERAMEVANEWGVEEGTWDRPWATLSGGEAQRISLATAVGLDCADILLLDEPTSALDSDTSTRVETHLQNLLKTPHASLKALIWITHSPEQGHRVGTRFLELSNGCCQEVLIPTNTV
ncbi:P-loop containing nucleoside triphosphate hydrolase protein [Fomitiporia mediterranea MF3/22]|uniref:P-loop containing nucleoside triphosphate hydrolase protein n=1 Tax=Fomitiporia mediterranea (strain MF3/22) TaxID=694068 RepID=UPI00044075E2|nr:P-loop containing nucleoside triphosphate hydrolase protein [Fomitiporia mediterranea MF3/22]EJD06046.1 P-loop containing nucleoside triphosphate hydrolase protein [Fomitiporia mediterranea MF3/22]